MRFSQQSLGIGSNVVRYHELIDDPTSVGYRTREEVIFPTLFRLISQYMGSSTTPLVDVGSGTGSLTARLSEVQKGIVRGYELSEQFVAFARKRYPDISFQNMQAYAKAGLSVHHSNSHLVLHCVDELERHVDKLIDSTEPNGYLFVTIPHPDTFKRFLIHKEKSSEVIDTHIRRRRGALLSPQPF